MSRIFSRKLDINGNKIYEGSYVRLKNQRQSDDLPDESYGLYKVVFDNGAFDLQLILNNWFNKDFKSTLEAKHETTDDECPVLPIIRRPISGYEICEVVTEKYAKSLIEKHKDKVEPEPKSDNETYNVRGKSKK